MTELEDLFEIDYLAFRCLNNKINLNKLLVEFQVNDISVIEEDYFERYSYRPLIIDRTHKSKVVAYFVKKENSLFQIDFRGSSAFLFFDKIKSNNFLNNQAFELCRIDIKRDQPISQGFDIRRFYYDCLIHIKEKDENRNINWIDKKKSSFSINSRAAQSFFRFYERENSLRMEMELKNKSDYFNEFFLIDKYLFKKKLEDLFIRRLSALVPLELEPFHWLVVERRKIKDTPLYLNSPDSLGFDYVEMDNLIKYPESIVNFGKLLEFSKTLKHSITVLDKDDDDIAVNYRKYKFPVTSFYRHIHSSKNKVSYYEVKKLVEFFASLQENSLVKCYSEDLYRSLVTIPFSQVKKVSNRWQVKILICDDLYYYNLPFIIPDYFEENINKYRFDVRFALLKSFLEKGISKKFNVDDFFKSCSKLSNSDISKCYSYMLEGLIILYENKTITDKLKLLPLLPEDKFISIEDINNTKYSNFKGVKTIIFYENC